ncbi:MAG: hypothetical protein GWO20_19175 [Candidatus Korarchaeota archaeon]|nr:hypothetical protein [Candidatus Korarchaeota archaeon]NIU85379.1 hypothetical protein [Candidatus Thorarchaeota archaeon]NIW15477.1 hypothetical protein [Candidatus Thorarchaeota archaeon]NIW53421.1 hypothetical protein [Candidatus Korarchaeota archaeon]
MSYVEKAIYRYLKAIFTTGIKVFFSKKYLLFTLSFLFLSFFTTALVFFPSCFTILGLSIEWMKSFSISAEVAVAVNFIVYGLFVSHYPTKYWGVPLVLTSAGSTVLFHLYTYVIPYIAAGSYFTWTFLVVLLTFSLSRNFWGSKVLGSILFLGKKSEEGGILFAPIILIITLANAGMSSYLIYTSYNLTNFFMHEALTFVAAIFALLAVLVILVIVIKVGSRDDVFYTILSFFYVFSCWTLWRMVYATVQGTIYGESIWSLFISFFFIFFTGSRIGARVEKLEAEVTAQKEAQSAKRGKKPKKSEDTFDTPFLHVFSHVEAEGAIMCVLGLMLGYHVTFLQLVTSSPIFPAISLLSLQVLPTIRDMLGVILVTFLLVVFLASYRWSPMFRGYASPELYRFEFLPSFEELVETLEGIRRGETSWKIYVLHLLKEGVKAGLKSAGKKAITTPIEKMKKFAEKLFKGEEE